MARFVQRLHEETEFVQTRRLQFAGHARDDAADVAHLRFGALDQATEPEQVVGSATRQIVGAAAQFERRRLWSQQRNGFDRSLR